jgi:hypothetical protein
MHRYFLLLWLVLATIAAQAQGTVKGRILDKQTDEVMQFVNVKITDYLGIDPVGEII